MHQAKINRLTFYGPDYKLGIGPIAFENIVLYLTVGIGNFDYDKVKSGRGQCLIQDMNRFDNNRMNLVLRRFSLGDRRFNLVGQPVDISILGLKIETIYYFFPLMIILQKFHCMHQAGLNRT